MTAKRPAAVFWRFLLIIIVIVLSVRAASLALSRLETRSPDLETIIGADSLSTDTLSVELTTIHPATDGSPIPSISGAVLALNRRLRDVMTVGRYKGEDYRLLFQGGYGSGFLRLNEVGNDLDYSLKVHLGSIDIGGKDNDEIADLILSEIEKFVVTYLEVMISELGSDLYPKWFSYLDEGKLRSREFLRKHLAESLVSLWENRRHCMVFDSRARILVPTEVPSGTLTLWTYLMPTNLSDRVTYTEDMFPGIREMSVSLAFMVDLDDGSHPGSGRTRKDVPIASLQPYSGKDTGFNSYFIFVAPEKEHSAKYLRSLVAADPQSWVFKRIMTAGDLLREVEVQIERGLPLKALKRLHQAYECLLPAFDNRFREEIEAFLSAGLNDPGVLLNEEIRVLSIRAADAVSYEESADIYMESGDLPLTLGRISADLNELSSASDSVLSTEARQLRLRLMEDMLSFHSPDIGETSNDLRQTLRKIAERAETWTAYRLKKEEGETLRWKEKITTELIACGFRPVPVYCLSKERDIGVLKGDIEGLATIEELNALSSEPGDCGWRYRIIERGEIPPDRYERTDYHPYVMWLRPAVSDIEEARYRKVRSLLEEDLHWFMEEKADEAANR